MPTARKFNFDECFDLLPAGNDPTFTTRPDMPEPDAAAEESFTAQDIANAERQGFAAGQAAAQAEIDQNSAQTEATALSAIGILLQQMSVDHHEALQAHRQGAIAIAAAIARKLVPGLVEKHAMDEIQRLFGDCISRLLDEPRIVVRANEAIVDALQEKMAPLAEANGFSGHLIILGEPGLPEVDCRIEWADGGAERDTGKLWQEVDQVIARYLTDPALRDAKAQTEPEPNIEPEPGPAPAGELPDEHLPPSSEEKLNG